MHCYIQVSIDVPMRLIQQRHPIGGSTTALSSGCHDALPSDGRDVAATAAAAVISAAVGKQLYDSVGVSSSSAQQQQQHSNGTKVTEPTSGDVVRDAKLRFDVTAKREPAGAAATKAKSEIQKFYQIKEKVGTNKLNLASLSLNTERSFLGFSSLHARKSYEYALKFKHLDCFDGNRADGK